MKNFLHHLFLPRESNNHRAKILHHKSLFLIITALFIGQFLISSIKINFPSVLGTTTDISTQELLLLTNQKRQSKGLPLLVLNEKLSLAAINKAKDMLEKNYWAHNSPNGVTPWFFIQKNGYEYTYAGENLARGFSSSKDVVNAWMASSTHRENLLSQNYKDIGFAVVKGKLLGEETTLIVEIFGSTVSPTLAKAEVKEAMATSTTYSQEMPSVAGLKSNSLNLSVNLKPLIDSNTLSLNISVILVCLFIFILILDMIIVERKKIIRIVGHNIDHVFFLVGVLAILLIFGKGITL